MPTQADLANAERKVKDQLRKIQLAKKGLPTDGTIATTQAEVARHFKVERSTVHTWLEKDDFPCKQAPFDLRRIEQWREAKRVESELIDSDADSPWLERLRQMKALQEEIKLEQLRGSVVEVDQVRSELMRFIDRLKRGTELLAVRYGSGAADIINDVITEWELSLDDFDCQYHDDENEGEPAEVDGGAVPGKVAAQDEPLG